MSHPPLHAKGFGQECVKDQPIMYHFLSSLVTLDVFWLSEDLLEKYVKYQLQCTFFAFLLQNFTKPCFTLRVKMLPDMIFAATSLHLLL